MTALINNDHLTNPSVAKFLRESQCGISANSHKVCCNVHNVDAGGEPTLAGVTAPAATTVKPPLIEPPPVHNDQHQQQSTLAPPIPPPAATRTPSGSRETPISDVERCGKLTQDEAPFKWIAELWFKHDKLGRIVYEAKCLGVAISAKHIVLPAHCVASLPANVSL
jgi:hypothetical protein